MLLERSGTNWMLEGKRTDVDGVIENNRNLVETIAHREREFKSLVDDYRELENEYGELEEQNAVLKSKLATEAGTTLTQRFDLLSFLIGVAALGLLLLLVFNLDSISKGIGNAASLSIGDLIGGITIGWIVALGLLGWLGYRLYQRRKSAEEEKSYFRRLGIYDRNRESKTTDAKSDSKWDVLLDKLGIRKKTPQGGES